MATTSNNLVSDCCITDVLAEIGLNILEKNTDTTLDIEHDNNGILNLLCVSDKANACDTEEDIKPYSAPETSNISDVLERKSNAGEQKSINYSKHILEITENNTEYGQPVKKKLRLSNVTPNKKTSMCGKAESQETWCPPYVPSCTSKTSIFPRNQNTGLPFSVNSSEMFIEKHFGLGMRNTLVTLPTITEKMSGKQAIPMTRIRGFVNKILQNNDSENKDWVIAGVIVKKYITTSKAGKQYCSWTLSDLGERPLTVTVLLFASVFKALWKASLGTVVGILNPSAMETRSQHDGEATFTVRSADQIMLWGYSSDFGICEQKKKNGEKCGMFFNKRMYDCCIYHVVKTYKEFCGGRSELQKATGRNLRQTFSKKMGWSTPMGNRSTGFEEKVPVRRNQNLIQKDRNLLASLENVTETKEKCSDKVEMNATQTDLNFEIQPKTKLQEMLLLSRSNSSGIPNKVSDTVSVYHKNLRLGKNSKVTAEKETYCLKPSFTVTNPKNKTCNRTVNNKKERFEKLVLPTFFDSAGKKFQNAGNKGFNPKASIDKIMAAKRTNMFSETDFSLCIDNENSSMDKCNNKNNNNLMEYVANQNVSHQNKMAESVLEVCKAEAEYNTPELNEQNHCTDDESGSVSLITTNPVGQIKICKIVTKSDISAKSDHHKDREPSENENAKQLSDKLNRKKKTFTKNMCSQVNDEMQSKTFTGKLQSLKSPVAPDPQSSYGNRSRSMMEAIRYVREHGPIQKNRKSLEMKRLMSESGEESTAKEVDKFNGTTVISDKFTELMNTESTHTQLAESSAMEEYYNKMEQKEKIEEKLLNTYKVECKVVMCKVCKYKAGSASEFCKQNNHPLICVKGYRRFFGCSDCRKRIVIYDIFPRHNCVHCGSSSWIRVPVIEVKTTLADLNQLSLRGDELKFLNSCESNANINLLVPEG